MSRIHTKEPVTIDGKTYQKYVRGGYNKNLGHFSFRVSHKGERWFPVFLIDENDWSKGYYGSTRA